MGRLEDFAATAAHDLNEPLRMIKSYLDLLQRREGASLTPAGQEYLGYALGAAQRMRALVDGLLAHAVAGRPVGGEPRHVRELLQEALLDLKVAIAETEAEISLGKFPAALRLGEVEGRLVLSNLLGNALKYCGKARPRVSVTARTRERDFLLEVADNGIGIPPELSETIFEPFTRGDHPDAPRGTGLGLATCRKLVEGWGGRIWCEARPQGGTRFLLTVPRK